MSSIQNALAPCVVGMLVAVSMSWPLVVTAEVTNRWQTHAPGILLPSPPSGVIAAHVLVRHGARGPYNGDPSAFVQLNWAGELQGRCMGVAVRQRYNTTAAAPPRVDLAAAADVARVVQTAIAFIGRFNNSATTTGTGAVMQSPSAPPSPSNAGRGGGGTDERTRLDQLATFVAHPSPPLLDNVLNGEAARFLFGDQTVEAAFTAVLPLCLRLFNQSQRQMMSALLLAMAPANQTISSRRRADRPRNDAVTWRGVTMRAAGRRAVAASDPSSTSYCDEEPAGCCYALEDYYTSYSASGEWPQAATAAQREQLKALMPRIRHVLAAVFEAWLGDGLGRPSTPATKPSVPTLPGGSSAWPLLQSVADALQSASGSRTPSGSPVSIYTYFSHDTVLSSAMAGMGALVTVPSSTVDDTPDDVVSVVDSWLPPFADTLLIELNGASSSVSVYRAAPPQDADTLRQWLLGPGANNSADWHAFDDHCASNVVFNLVNITCLAADTDGRGGAPYVSSSCPVDDFARRVAAVAPASFASPRTDPTTAGRVLGAPTQAVSPQAVSPWFPAYCNARSPFSMARSSGATGYDGEEGAGVLAHEVTQHRAFDPTWARAFECHRCWTPPGNGTSAVSLCGFSTIDVSNVTPTGVMSYLCPIYQAMCDRFLCGRGQMLFSGGTTARPESRSVGTPTCVSPPSMLSFREVALLLVGVAIGSLALGLGIGATVARHTRTWMPSTLDENQPLIQHTGERST